MNYKLIEKSDLYQIFETKTSQVIESFSDKEKARKYLRYLNLGGSFDGFTPSFMLKKFCTMVKNSKSVV